MISFEYILIIYLLKGGEIYARKRWNRPDRFPAALQRYAEGIQITKKPQNR
jgi:hypothetical protein